MSCKDLLTALVDDRSDQAVLADCDLRIGDRNVLEIRVPDRLWPDFLGLFDDLKPCRLEVDAVWIWRGDRLWVQMPTRLWSR
jgi:hypothetical protein